MTKLYKVIGAYMNLKNKKGQSLTEFVLLFPVLFLVFLVAIQFILIIEKRLDVEKAVWSSLTGYAMVEYMVVQPISKYSRSELEKIIKNDCFSPDDDASVSFGEYVGGVSANVVSESPFLYQGMSWKMIWDVFGGMVHNKKIRMSSEGWILKSPMASK